MDSFLSYAPASNIWRRLAADFLVRPLALPPKGKNEAGWPIEDSPFEVDVDPVFVLDGLDLDFLVLLHGLLLLRGPKMCFLLTFNFRCASSPALAGGDSTSFNQRYRI